LLIPSDLPSIARGAALDYNKFHRIQFKMAYWIVHKTGNPRFPYRIAISDENGDLFAVRAQDSWPGARGNIFCVRDGSSKDERDLFIEVERVPIVVLERFGKSIRVVLDRAIKKRGEFLILEKPYKNREGNFEQIFFKTDIAQKGHKSRSRVSLRPSVGVSNLVVAIDSAERYPWKFPKAQIERRRLPCGDYALMDGEDILAITERKTFENLLGDFESIAILHRSLEELSTYSHAAIVVEAHYGDFMDPKRLEGRWQPSHAYRVIAELQAMHPHLPMIFAGTRKEANLWTYAYFRAIAWKRTTEKSESAALLARETPPQFTSDQRLNSRIFSELQSHSDGVTFRELMSSFDDVDGTAVRRVLTALKNRGKARCEGRGITARWFDATSTK